MQVYWEISKDLPQNPVSSAVSSEAGFPSMAQLVERYAERSSLDLAPLPWYVAFARYKLAIIAEGIHYRFTQGKTVGGGFSHLGAVVAPLVAAALQLLPTEGA
jgi:aminoglycoside phosphotransferase (APT) family kinase protein